MENGLIITIIIAGLFAFGLAYDRLVAWVEKKHRDHGLTSILVVLGVLVTLIGVGLMDLFVDWNAGFTGLLAFAASGGPMAGGSMLRYLLRAADEDRRIRELTISSLEGHDDDEA